MFQLGIDRLLKEENLRAELKGKRVALLGHPASMTSDFRHSLDALMLCKDLKITAAFGPQHGMRGEKQDNMMESEDYLDPVYQIPVYSLYGQVRKPTEKMMKNFDVLLIDMQDLGTRIYTFLTTLLYVLQAASLYKKSVWILDRPNPVGRPIEGGTLREGWESFVGAGPLPMRHGLTLAEASKWFVHHYFLNLNLKIIEMSDYNPAAAPGYGWPEGKLSWVNPSPNAATLSMARAYPGTVMIEGTTLSEGRGTTRPLELLGAKGLDGTKWLKEMEALAPHWMEGCLLRPCFFQPTFHKFIGELCGGFQIHCDTEAYRHDLFKPYRLIALSLKALRKMEPSYPIWRDFPYEYEFNKLAIDVIHGGTYFREWVDDSNAKVGDLERILGKDEMAWAEARRPFLIY